MNEFPGQFGADDAPGSLAHPIRSLDRALALGRSVGRFTILLRAGTYELTQPLHITAGNAPLRISNYAREEPILSGGTRLQLDWRPFRDGIFQATVPSGTTTDQLFINNRQLSGQDVHSPEGDAHFDNSEHGNFTVHADSPAIKLGFRNILIHEYGVRSPRLRALARTSDVFRLLQVHPRRKKLLLRH